MLLIFNPVSSATSPILILSVSFLLQLSLLYTLHLVQSQVFSWFFIERRAFFRFCQKIWILLLIKGFATSWQIPYFTFHGYLYNNSYKASTSMPFSSSFLRISAPFSSNKYTRYNRTHIFSPTSTCLRSRERFVFKLTPFTRSVSSR